VNQDEDLARTWIAWLQVNWANTIEVRPHQLEIVARWMTSPGNSAIIRVQPRRLETHMSWLREFGRTLRSSTDPAWNALTHLLESALFAEGAKESYEFTVSDWCTDERERVDVLRDDTASFQWSAERPIGFEHDAQSPGSKGRNG
jgi:hypothetical protein